MLRSQESNPVIATDCFAEFVMNKRDFTSQLWE